MWLLMTIPYVPSAMAYACDFSTSSDAPLVWAERVTWPTYPVPGLVAASRRLLPLCCNSQVLYPTVVMASVLLVAPLFRYVFRAYPVAAIVIPPRELSAQVTLLVVSPDWILFVAEPLPE